MFYINQIQNSKLTCFLNSVLRPFQDYFSSYETAPPREKPPDTPASRTWLVSHVARAELAPTPDTFDIFTHYLNIHLRRMGLKRRIFCYFKQEDQWSCKRSPEICFIYQLTYLNIMVFNPSAGADEALEPFYFVQNNQYSVHLPISC